MPERKECTGSCGVSYLFSTWLIPCGFPGCHRGQACQAQLGGSKMNLTRLVLFHATRDGTRPEGRESLSIYQRVKAE